MLKPSQNENALTTSQILHHSHFLFSLQRLKIEIFFVGYRWVSSRIVERWREMFFFSHSGSVGCMQNLPCTKPKGDKTLIWLARCTRRKWCHQAQERQDCFARRWSWPAQASHAPTYFCWFAMQRVSSVLGLAAYGCLSVEGKGFRWCGFKNSPSVRCSCTIASHQSDMI